MKNLITKQESLKKSLFALSFAALALFSQNVFAGETPRSTVQRFINCCKNGNVQGVKAQVAIGSKLGNGDAEGILAMQLMFQGAYIESVEKTGFGKAIVYVSIKNPVNGERFSSPVSVKKINGEWLII